MAGPISTAAREEDQVTGEGLVLLDHDDVPNSQLSALLPNQLAVLDEMNRALVHGIVCFMAKPVFIALKNKLRKNLMRWNDRTVEGPPALS